MSNAVSNLLRLAKPARTGQAVVSLVFRPTGRQTGMQAHRQAGTWSLTDERCWFSNISIMCVDN